jgi:hypothetical protein
MLLTSIAVVSAQRPCDTLITADQVRIPAQIIRAKEGYLYYYRCDDFVKREEKIARNKIIDLKQSKEKKEALEALVNPPTIDSTRTASKLTWVGSNTKWVSGTCDTLLTKDGQKIVGKIQEVKDSVIYFYPCKGKTHLEQSIPQSDIKAYLPEYSYDDLLASNEADGLSEDQKLLNHTSIAIIGGFNPVDLLSNPAYYLEDLGNTIELFSPLHFGLQLQVKRQPLQIQIMCRPYFYNEYEVRNFKSIGTNAEFTFAIKKINIGRITGRIKRGYWGAEFQYGKRQYTFDTSPPTVSPATTTKREGSVFSVLSRFGVQKESGPLYWDLACLLGCRKSQTIMDGIPEPFHGKWRLSYQPVFNIGIRF